MARQWLLAVVLVTLAAAQAAAQNCPATPRNPLYDQQSSTGPFTKWFWASSTPAVFQAAFTFDVPRLQCLARAGKSNIVKRDRSASSFGFKWGNSALAATMSFASAAHHNFWVCECSPDAQGLGPEAVSVTQILLDAGLSPNTAKDTPSEKAARSGVAKETVLHALLASTTCDCKPVAGTDEKPCCRPLSANYIKLVKALVNAGADPNVRDAGKTLPRTVKGPFSALVASLAQSGTCDSAQALDLVGFLVAKGADPNWGNKNASGATKRSALQELDARAKDKCPKLRALLTRRVAVERGSG